MKSSLLAALLVVATVVQAQSVTGKLTDDNNLPLEYANVVLLALSDSAFVQGGVTNAEGRFKIDLTALDDGARLAERYLLRASCIGYETLYRTCSVGDQGTLMLKPDGITLNETVVTATRPTHRLKGNGLVTGVAGSMLSTLGTGADVLAHIPFVQGEGNNFTVFGKGAPLIYLNGRLLYDTSELERLSSKDILSVEVITNPGAEYDVSVKAVIKIKTVKPKGEGLSGSLFANGTQNHHFSHGEDVYLNYRRGGLDFFGEVYYGHYKSMQEQRTDMQVNVDTLWLHHANSEMLGSGHSLYLMGGFNYMIDSNHSLGVRYNFNRTPRSRFRMLSGYEIMADGAFYDNQQYDADWANNSYSHGLNAYYMGSVGRLGIDFNVDYYTGQNRHSQENREESEVHEDRYVTTRSTDDSRLYAAKLVLTHPVGRGELKGGAEYSYTRRLAAYENPQNYLPETDDRIEEEKLAAFVELAISLGKLQAQAGLRYEHVTSDYYEYGRRIDEQSRAYSDLFPNLSLAMPLGKTQLSLSYTAKTRRPYYSELSSNLQYDNRFTYEGGNPNLKPVVIHDLTLMGIYKWARLYASYKLRRDDIEFVAHSYEENPAITILTRENFDKQTSLATGLSLSPQFGIYEPTLNLQMSRQWFKAPYNGGEKSFNRPIYSGQLNNFFRFSKSFTGTLSFYYTCKGNSGIMMCKANGGMDLSLNKTFLNDRLTLNLRATDLLASRRNSALFYSDYTILDKWNYSDSRSVRFTIRYNFNATRNKYRGSGAANDELNRL